MKILNQFWQVMSIMLIVAAVGAIAILIRILVCGGIFRVSDMFGFK